MPKSVININDFSGGLNKAQNPRDIAENQAQELDGLMSYTPGTLVQQGGFIRPVWFKDYSGGFSEEYVAMGINNLYGIEPENSFRIVGRSNVAVSSGTATHTEKDSGPHGLVTGTKVMFWSANDEALTSWDWKIAEITVTSETQFTHSTTGMSISDGTDGDLTYFVGAYNSDKEVEESVGDFEQAQSYTGVQSNKFLLKAASHGKFGFYSVGSPSYWYGSLNETSDQFAGSDPYLFDTRYLWDCDQKENPTMNSSDDTPIESLKVYDAFYETGMIRVLTEPSGFWNNGTCRRPVNYTYLSRRIDFATTTDGTNPSERSKHITLPGWYPLRSHILCQQEYKQHNLDIFYSQGTLQLDFDATTRTTFESSFGGVTDGGNPYYCNVGVGTSDNATEGDWQFATGAHKKLKLGTSLIYDNMTFSLQQESPVCILSGEADFGSEGDVADNKALTLWMELGNGSTADTSSIKAKFGIGSSATLKATNIPENRGSGVGNGESNSGTWNPRILGINIWVVGDDTGDYDDPLWLAEVPFDSESFVRTCDNKKATDPWLESSETQYRSTIFVKAIQTIPTLSYSLKNGYKWDDNISAWYKTAAVVNRRLYAGNVSYFDIKPQKMNADTNANQRMVSFPDRIIRSPREKFDILPQDNWIDIMPQDGQNIVKLVAFNQELLVFKDNDLFVVDCSGEFERLAKTFTGKGLTRASHVVKSSDYIFWVNKNGVFGYNGTEAQVVDLTKDRIDALEWKNMFNYYSNPIYDPDENLLIIFVSTTFDLTSHNRAIIFDINTGALFFKTQPCVWESTNHSGAVIMDGKTYMTSFITGYTPEDGFADQGDEFWNSQDTDFELGEETMGEVSFKLGSGDSAVNVNAPSNNVKYMFIRNGTSWAAVNSSDAFDVTTTNSNKVDAAKFFVAQANSALAKHGEYRFVYRYNEEDDLIICTIKAKSVGTIYNSTAEANPNSVSGYGTTGVAFGSGTSESNINIGNITDFTFTGLTNGANAVAGVTRISVNRNGTTKSGVGYVISVHLRSDDQKASDIHLQGTYVTGHSSFYKAATSSNYADETDASASSNTRNDRLITNIHEFLQNNKLTDTSSGAQFYLTEFFSFGSLSGSSGSKYFQMTSTHDDYNDPIINTEAYTGNGSELFHWSNTTTSVIGKSAYATKDIDFGQPNVRKKVYKAYITYKGGEGNITVQYAANQGSFTNATVTGASVSSKLDNQSSFTRQEITFGSGGNNVYSFALRFISGNGVQEFEINDISIIYRMKSPK